MKALAGILAVALLAALIGIAKPYIAGWTRKRFAMVSAGLFFAFAIVNPAQTPQEIAAEKEAQNKRAQGELAAKEAKAKEEAPEKLRQFTGQTVKDAIREAARNPASVSFSKVEVSEDASLVCVVYRAQNGFGGMNKEFMAFKDGKSREGSAFWDANCAHAKLYSQPTY